MVKKISIFWVILFALVITNATPLAIMAVRGVQTLRSGIEAEQRSQLQLRVDAQSDVINEKFLKFQAATELVAIFARNLLVTKTAAIPAEEVQARMAKYKRESEAEVNDRLAKQPAEGDSIIYDDKSPYELGVLGLDNWYNTVYYPNKKDNRQSNVFLNNKTPLNPKIEYDIAATENLNLLFEGIADRNLGTQWIYLTTAEGMMRLYPWAGNYKYPVNWEPQKISFYTVAGPERNPARRSVWTAPYNDFARAGLMVTNSTPIYDGDKLVAVVSHDFLIGAIQSEVLNLQVSGQGQGTGRGFAFLIDNQGNIIAHRDYDPMDTPLGAELSRKLVDVDPKMGPVVGQMLPQKRGIADYTDAQGQQWVIVYSTIAATDWHLGFMQPLSEIVQPATDIRDQLLPIAVGLFVVVLGVSVFMARFIAYPMRQLTHTAEEIAANVDEQSLLSSESLGHIRGASETMRLVTVFSQMVNALKRRMSELDSIYAIGQTITANVDYDKTLHTLLTAVRQVVQYDMAEIGIVQGEEITVQAWLGKEGFRNTTGRTQKSTYGTMGVAATTKAPVFIPTITSVEDVQRTINQPEYDGRQIIEGAIKSLLAIPLLSGEKVIGVLHLLHRTPGQFTDDDCRQLIKLGAQASIAISNAIQVRQRETVLKEQIRELQIEIDEAKKSMQVQEIVESDFFRDLQQKADSMRARAKDTSKARSKAVDETKTMAEPSDPE